ncbi:conserved hypothetical protein [Desulfonatronospira thiodismutans ASO3-1]|uniref:Uncharacterized protein n=1 Tax=Desulfonatronospira thiodismutans ASO3-1 TaxID=555779 RepID=D6SL23_9BACT|nr:conserved hypothetical protein [Desulfonatronospira thiodismutans ASO3-1]RQD79277.1 MAG: hypothetical protein D5S03_00515 [Desulfonatronospira sp. MSAO_Bac3]
MQHQFKHGACLDFFAGKVQFLTLCSVKCKAPLGSQDSGRGAAHGTDNVAPVFVVFMLLPLSGSVSESGSKIPGSVPLDFASGFDSDCEPDTDPDTDYQRKHGHFGIMEVR